MTREDLLNAMATDALREESLNQAKKIQLVKNHIQKDTAIQDRAKAHLVSMGQQLNRFESDFFSKTRNERFALLDQGEPPSVVDRLFASFLSTGSYASNMRTLIRLAKTFGSVSVMTIQSSVALPASDRREMISNLLSERAASDMILFQTTPSLLGGLRVFHQGQLSDKSVRGRITQTFNQLKHV